MNSSTNAAPLVAELLLERYQRVRRFSEQIASPLSAEDCAVQTVPEVSPTKWHLAHTTWFFETFVLSEDHGYVPFNTHYESLFNSYYNSIGPAFPRDRRGHLSRPSLADVMEYRQVIDGLVVALLQRGELSARALRIVELGLNHEQQHQELMFTDIKHVLFSNPMHPAYVIPEDSPRNGSSEDKAAVMNWTCHAGGTAAVGFAGEGFCFDNETPRHMTYIQQHCLASRCVTNSEYGYFIADGGYQRAELWLSLGWQVLQQYNWQAPLYWLKKNGSWHQYTLSGLVPLNHEEPVCHISYYEADAYARWMNKRLPTEFEWELSALGAERAGVFADQLLSTGKCIHPEIEGNSGDAPEHLFGNLWEWTSSPYTPYPGYRTDAGALGEYNGKFMCNQYVLRGGSCATSSDHIRATYRNYFPPETRWQFTGIRLAQ
jgi:ergothioneine biosynthesis protein EgtB